ncbi:MAG: DnaJ domain-containing protein [Acidobacteria bacterium]|nr:DnaJ domain-containing protein [Acidobacteriota bacterium]
MVRTPTHYEVLHVQPDAPREIVHMSYLTLMRRLRMHPDLGGDPDMAARINDAFAVLSDPEARARYDRTLAAASERRAEAAVLLPPADEAPRQAAASPVTACEFCGTLHPARDLTRPSAICALCASPLYPASMHEQDDTARRAFHRISREWPLAFHFAYPYGAPLTGTTRDLSISGLRFTTAHRLSPEDRLRLTCAFCDAIGVVRHVHHGLEHRDEPWSVGVAFLTLRINLAPGGIVSKLI